jgi:hypothetical protein
MKTLDIKTLEALAELICGTWTPYYRSNYELPKFFRNCGLSCVDHDGTTRKWWVLDRLKEYDKQLYVMEKIIHRLADPKEYKGDSKITNIVISKLNEILCAEGYKIKLVGVQPKIQKIKPILFDKPKEISSTISKPDFLKIIDDKSMNEILQLRCEETIRCIDGKAYLSAVIMMGSILEGTLFSVISKNPKDVNTAKSSPKDKNCVIKKFSDWTLSDMIEVAHELKWVKGDVKQFSHSLRDYRNMIHPLYQKLKGEYPDEDSCKICWQVVVAAINDLIKTFTIN